MNKNTHPKIKKQLEAKPIVSTMSDEDLAELGITPEQAQAFDRYIARSEQEAREHGVWLDAMHDG